MAIKTFKRQEVKYLLNPEQFEIIKAVLMKHMVLDKHCRKTGSYMIYNLYYDTDNDEIIRRSISKPYYKEKLRLRSYKIPIAADDTVFFELKKKVGGIVSKRRASMTYAEAMKFVDTRICPKSDNYLDTQVINEIADFLHRNPARPKVFISYERTAFFDKDNKEFRISFDRDIITCRNHVNFTDGDFGSELMDYDTYLMEVKLNSQIPLWLCRYLSSMKIYSTSFSKYGTEYKQYTEKKIVSKTPDNIMQYENTPVYDYSRQIITV